MYSKKKPIVAYIAYIPYGIKYFKRFIKNYRKYKSGYYHDLIICFKGSRDQQIINKWKKKINFNFEYLIDDPINDYDIGSYFRIAKKYKKRDIFFISTYSYPVKKNWLKFFFDHYEKKTFIGASGSYSSISTDLLTLSYKHPKLLQLIWGIKSLLSFKLSPNPHVRTGAFLINSNDLLSRNFNPKKFVKKIETNKFESGRKSLTNQLLKKGFKVGIINSDNKFYEINSWRESETYGLKKQKKLIIHDNRTLEFQKLNKKGKFIVSKKIWLDKV